MAGRSWGALLCAVAVAAGAFGAHGLESLLDARGLELWETAARYLMYAGLGLMVVEVSGRRDAVSGGRLGYRLLLVGALVFSATLFALALGGPRWLGAVTPLGGASMIAGFLLFVGGKPRRE